MKRGERGVRYAVEGLTAEARDLNADLAAMLVRARRLPARGRRKAADPWQRVKALADEFDRRCDALEKAINDLRADRGRA